MMKVAYVRVSTAEQNEDRQVKALENNKIEKWFIEKISGKNTNRPKLQEMLDFVREGDVIYVHDLSIVYNDNIFESCMKKLGWAYNKKDGYYR